MLGGEPRSLAEVGISPLPQDCAWQNTGSLWKADASKPKPFPDRQRGLQVGTCKEVREGLDGA